MSVKCASVSKVKHIWMIIWIFLGRLYIYLGALLRTGSGRKTISSYIVLQLTHEFTLQKQVERWNDTRKTAKNW